MAASAVKSNTMAAEAAAEIMSQKLDILLSRPEWVGCCAMETLVKDAKAKLATIQGFFSTIDRPLNSTEWPGRLLQDLYNAEKFIDKFRLKVAHRRHEALHTATRPLVTLVHKYMLWRHLSNLVKAMEESCQDQYLTDKEAEGGTKREPASSSSRAGAPREGQKLASLSNFWDRQASTNFVWLVTLKDKIVERIRKEAEFKLERGNVHAISIWGKEGTGKTFLARWVYREAMYLGFDTRAWVHVSAINDRQEFLFEILKQVDKLASGVMDFKEIKKMLNQKLASGNRFLLVLDDVHPSNEELLDELWMTIQPYTSQGHIITTTQHRWIAWLMNLDGGELIELVELDHEERWSMLALKLHSGPHVPSLVPEEVKILNRFPALPLCISLLGGLLSHAEAHERAALTNDASPMSVSDLLEVSYRRLPVHLKLCIIYMALFPVASPIPTRRLVRLWLAEGLLDSHCYDGEKTPEEVGDTFIMELADRNVIDVVSWRADGSPKACQMLTSLYDLIAPIATSTGFIHIHNASKSKGGKEDYPTPEETKVRWLAEHTVVRGGRDCSYPNLKLSQVRSFLSFYTRRGIRSEDIGTFLTKITSKVDYSLLRVLDLEGAYRPTLKGVLRKLVLLRYLGLRNTLLDSIPREVADLHYLETLDTKGSNITSLPSSLWTARNLRHLHLNWFYIDLKKILKGRRKNPMALTKLQTLSGLVMSTMTGHMNWSFDWLNMNSLTTLKLFLQHFDNGASSHAGEAAADWISSKLTHLQSLTFGVTQKAQPTKEATKVDKPDKEDEPTEEAEPTKEATKVDKPDREDKPEEEAQPTKGTTKVDKPEEEAKPAKEVEPTKEATKVDKPDKEDKPTEEAEPAKEATNVDKPNREVKPAEEAMHWEGAQPATSQIGPLPKLSLERHLRLLDLYLLGQLKKPSWTELLPRSLRVLTLSGSRVEADMMPVLGCLLQNLRTFRLLANSFLGTSLTFAKDGFPSLKILKIWKLPLLEKVTIEQGAMPHLKELEFRHLYRMTTVEWIKECSELENICVISPSNALVDQLNSEIGAKTNLHVEKDTKRPGSL